jgi:SAM-dependent methyltransferase
MQSAALPDLVVALRPAPERSGSFGRLVRSPLAVLVAAYAAGYWRRAAGPPGRADGCGGDRGHPTQLGSALSAASLAEHLPFTHEVFDLVFATLSLRHWTNPSAGIAEISRVLIPGGMLVLADVSPTSDPATRPGRRVGRVSNLFA